MLEQPCADVNILQCHTKGCAGGGVAQGATVEGAHQIF